MAMAASSAGARASNAITSNLYSPPSTTMMASSFSSFDPAPTTSSPPLHSRLMLSSVNLERISPNRPKWSARAIDSFSKAELEARKLKYRSTGTEALRTGILTEDRGVPYCDFPSNRKNTSTKDGLLAIYSFSPSVPMRAPLLLQCGRSRQLLGSERFFCYQVRAYQATTNSDGLSRPGKLTVTAFQGRISNLYKSSSEAFGNFPWDRMSGRLIERLLDLFGIVAKWLAIPILVLSSLGEFLYTLSAKKDLCIPLGIITGVLVARIVGKTALDVLNDVQDGKAPWPLFAVALVFLALKLPGPHYPVLAAAFLPHMANAGLVQTILLYREWQQKSL